MLSVKPTLPSDRAEDAAARPALQSRSRRTRDQIIGAATQLFGERGYSAVHTSEIAKRAGCSVGTLYNRFSDKDMLFAVILDQYCEKTRGLVDFGMADEDRKKGTCENILKNYVIFSSDHIHAHHGLFRAVVERAFDTPSIWQPISDVTAYSVSAVAAALLKRAPHLKLRRLQQRLTTGFDLVHSRILLDLLQAGPRTGVALKAQQADLGDILIAFTLRA